MNFLIINNLQDDFSIFLRLLVIIVLAGFLGWERERAGKAAGLRTHILVGIGSVLFVVLGESFVMRYREFHGTMQFDPIRIVEAVVTGISFLGAGIIFVAREQGKVRGLTTAASIWTTSAVGMVVGLERYVLAVGSTLIIFIVLRFVMLWEIKGNIKANEE
ncbi:MAG TPA: MgtC/SapB family protein [Pyrinomonadaceae bacterium]|nr:MgtC/SapB family protein [Pyrinomonadaceae bacterium]